MKQIPLTRGQVALVDDEDYEWLSRWKWYAGWNAHTRSYHARRQARIGGGAKKTFSMAAVILASGPEQLVDHWNHDTLDNQRHNLRTCDCCQNQWNARKPSDSKAPYKGISLETRPSRQPRWRASICTRGHRIYLGCFDNPIEAARAYDTAAKQYFGDFAYVNGV